MTSHPYHHGDLRHAILAVAVELIRVDGIGKLSLRELARRAGVSHAAPAHHFRDKTGLLTAIAAEGFETLADALAAPVDPDANILGELGVRYVRVALTHPAHFEVMWARATLRWEDSALAAAAQRALGLLRSALDGAPDAESQLQAAWSLAHGYAALCLGGNLAPGPDAAEAFRPIARQLFP
ncbi:TetR/AcrR family transcriptional regulator [Tomitella biformata]|uniref:TetR/AcrR family transcriptional regulator n=1 Tax=Tomitella biformata TaxID=630403 RepID=UPI0004B0E0B3|nr:TetR/AcrR family transcriptional regulator [Tomitella biformata]